MSRKGNARQCEQHFRQLLSYIDRKAERDFYIFHNLISGERTPRGRIVEEFFRNAQYANLRKNLNGLLHEVISITRGADSELESRKEVIAELTEQWLNKRARGMLAYGRLHVEKDHIHVHLCLSVNRDGEKLRARVTKREFTNFQREVEQYLHTNYPKLEREVYARDDYGRTKQPRRESDAERHIKKRGGQTRMDQLRNDLEQIFSNARSYKELEEALQEFDISLRKRGKSMVAERGTLKRRLSTFDLQKQYEQCLARFDKDVERNTREDKKEERTHDNKSERKMSELERRKAELEAIRRSYEEARNHEPGHEQDR